jgi:hypothetical protein
MPKIRLLLPPARCQRCVTSDLCMGCRYAIDHEHTKEARQARLESLFRYYTSGQAVKDWNRIRKDIGIGPIPSTEESD